jgi:DNA-directed RNA polymerase specialized sigma24 family protein
MMNSTADPRDLQTMLAQHRGRLYALVQQRAGAPLLRFETADDLVQGIQHEALRSQAQFRWQGEEAFGGWLKSIALRYLSGRRDYWFALKRNSGALLRLTWGLENGRATPGALPAQALTDTRTGPLTFAFKREQMVLATRALNLLMPRDREIVQWCTEGVALEEQAARLGIAREAAERARSRALERLRKCFELVSKSPSKED